MLGWKCTQFFIKIIYYENQSFHFIENKLNPIWFQNISFFWTCQKSLLILQNANFYNKNTLLENIYTKTILYNTKYKCKNIEKLDLFHWKLYMNIIKCDISNIQWVNYFIL